MRNFIALLITLLAFPVASTADIDLKRMKRDLTIQESVLDRFFDTEEGSTTGVYIKDYGIVLVARDMSHDIHVDMAKKAGRSHSIQVRIVQPDSAVHLNTGNSYKTKSNEENRETRKQRITEFLSTYGNAIGQLKNDDRVTILLRPASHKIAVRTGSPVVNYRVVDTDSTQTDSVRVEKRIYRTPSSRHEIDIEHLVNGVTGTLSEALKHYNNAIRVRVQRGDDDNEADPDDNLFEATALKSDIDAYNRNRIDEQTFQNRITFQEHKPQLSRDKKIDIMADILSSALKQDSDLHLLDQPKSTGFYQKDVGAMFLLSHHTPTVWNDDEAEPLASLKTTIIETIADYGPTLRELSPNETVAVHANLNGNRDFQHIVKIARINNKNKTSTFTRPENPDRILFRVKKRDIDAYANKKIDLNTFRKTVEITEM